MLFANIPGQKKAKEGLLHMWASNHFPHALMLVGNDGVGGLPMALAIAQYIFCENKQDNDACGVCVSCQKIMKQEHADLHLSYPTVAPKPGTKAMSKYYIQDFREFVKQTPFSSTYDWLQFINAENKQGNITAEECREVIDVLNLKSYEGKAKVQIVWRPEYFGKEGNILLKLIEEPPENTYLIFVAEDTQSILGTILSRTQMVRLAPISAEDIANTLTSKGLADETAALQIGHTANGSYAEALRLLQHADNDLFPEVKNWFNALFTNNGVGLTKFAEQWSKAGREQQKNLLQYTIKLLEHSLKAQYMTQTTGTLPAAEQEFVQKLGSMNLHVDVVGSLVNEISDTIHNITRNAHGKTQLQALCIKMSYIINRKQVPVL